MNKTWYPSAGRLFSKTVLTSAALVAGLLAVGLRAEAPLMNVPGAFEVSNSGAATYTIPISVPPGTAGMVPELALSYSSEQGNGLLGLGWQLAGLPVIQRCPRTVAQDGIKGSVTFTATDRFCLNGERLVAITGTYGANNTEYRTELESFTRVISYGTAGTGPQWFKVWTKSGEILEFGNTTDSRLMRYAASTTTVRAWFANKISDAAGNYMSVSYQNSALDGEVRPLRVDYTGHEGTPTLAPYNSVRFEYIARSDTFSHYQAAGEVSRSTQLLSKVKTFAGSTQINEYQLTYLPGSSVRPSRLQSVKLCAETATNCLPAVTTFGWPAVNDPITFTANSSRPATLHPSGQTVADFNGDGLPDFMPTVLWGGSTNPEYNPYWLSTSPDNWQLVTKTVAHQVPPLFMQPDVILSEYWMDLHPLDFNADGYTDVLINDTSTYTDIYTSQTYTNGPYRVSSSVNDKNGNLNIAKPGFAGAHNNALPFGDLNGDGRDDQVVLRPSPNGATVYIGNGDGSFIDGGTIPDVFANTSVIMLGDFDGNGCMDGMAQGAVNRIQYTCNPAQATANITNWASQGYKLILGDYNGDGMTDALAVHNTNNTRLLLATGNGFLDSGYAGPTGWAKYQVNAGDFNGDGRMDLALIAASTIGGGYGPTTPHQIYLSTGAGFLSSASIANPTGNNVATVDDFNGDGVADLWIYKPTATSNKNVEYITTYQPMLITSISDGLGSLTTISYNRLNANPTFYVKGTTAAYPEMELTGPQRLVAQVQFPNGIGGTRIYDYSYAGARLHQQGRGASSALPR